ARDRPHVEVVDASQSPLVFDVRNRRTRREPTPRYCDIAVEREEAWRRTTLHDVVEVGFVHSAGSSPILGTDSPRHTPALLAHRTVFKQVDARRPRVRRERTKGELQ